ncbi:MAG: cupin domain-containing protein, partial [Verrucomicrobiae bacterium]|nr:cupin domain-containing protein [Verrucomicrobiae bacterium]
RIPGQIHQWHDDIESCTQGEGFVSLWLGLENTTTETSLKIIPGSHQYNRLLFDIAQNKGVNARAIEDEKVEAWTRELNPESGIKLLDTADGDALFFDGRLWHGSKNTSVGKKRTAVLIQYCRPDKVIRSPKFNHNRWPIEYFQSPKPPCMIVRGSARSDINKIVPGPTAVPMDQDIAITTLIDTIDTLPNEPGDQDLKVFMLGRGPTTDLGLMECHYSVLAPGKMPHPPHIHDEEEIQMIVAGEAELISEDEKGSGNFQRFPAKPGDFIYLPANWCHTFENVSDKPCTCIIFKWISDEYHSDKTLRSTFVRCSDLLTKVRSPASQMVIDPLLRGKTGYLRTLEAHMATLEPGQSYEPHEDSYDVGIIHFEGEVETIGETITQPSFIYYSAGIKHGMKNIGTTTARHIAFEFHGKHGELYESPEDRRKRRLKESLTHPGIIFKHLKWRIGQLLKRGGHAGIE